MAHRELATDEEVTKCGKLSDALHPTFGTLVPAASVADVRREGD